MNKIIPKNREELLRIIQKEIDKNGNECDLNHIDVSNITTMNGVFQFFKTFNGNISEWDVSNVLDMNCMFAYSFFNGDISKWNTSKLEDMYGMFANSQFNGDISKWDVSKVFNMCSTFLNAEFNKSLNNWKPYSLEESEYMFLNSKCIIPYWDNLGKEERNSAINKYVLSLELKEELTENKNKIHKNKI